MPISILAVDDEQNLLELLLTVLGKRGFAGADRTFYRDVARSSVNSKWMSPTH